MKAILEDSNILRKLTSLCAIVHKKEKNSLDRKKYNQ